MSLDLARVEQIVEAAGIASELEALLPIGVRPRQLRVRTLLIGMLLCVLDGRPTHLRRVHQALRGLPHADQHRLAVIVQWNTGPHRLTYRQVERTFGLIVGVLSKPQPDGAPSQLLSETLDALLEASVTVLGQPASTSYAVDWTDLEAWARPPHKPRAETPDSASRGEDDDHHDDSGHSDATGGLDDRRQRTDREAAWGHRNSNHPAKSDMFYGYYLQAITTVTDEHGPPVAELVRRMQLCSCDHDPPAQIVAVIARMKASGIPIGDLLADSGYSYRVPETWALPLRALGIQLIQDLHPADRGTCGTHMGATCANGNLYCPATPASLLELGPLARGSSSEQTLAHDHRSAELARYKLSPISAYDQDGYRRVACPATQHKIRCPLRPQSLTLAHDRPTIHTPPEHPPVCCAQQTITVPPQINAKTAQKHDYPSRAHRESYNRRSAAERTFAQTTDPATNTLARGNCRLTGLTPIALFTASVLIARNLRIADAFNTRQADNQRRASQGLPPKQRKRRRQTSLNPISAATPADSPP